MRTAEEWAEKFLGHDITGGEEAKVKILTYYFTRYGQDVLANQRTECLRNGSPACFVSALEWEKRERQRCRELHR